jgi:hypothetical protein
LPTDGSVEVVDITAPKQKLLAQPMQAIHAILGNFRPTSSPLWAAPLIGQTWQALFAHERFWLLAPELPEIGK